MAIPGPSAEELPGLGETRLCCQGRWIWAEYNTKMWVFATVTSCYNNEKRLFRRRGTTPSSSMVNCCLDSSSWPVKQPEKVPCSSRLYQMTKPSPSQCSIFMRFLRRLRKRNRAPVSRFTWVRGFDQPAQSLEALSRVDALVVKKYAVNARRAQTLKPPSVLTEGRQAARSRILWRHGSGRRCIRDRSERQEQ